MWNLEQEDKKGGNWHQSELDEASSCEEAPRGRASTCSGDWLPRAGKRGSTGERRNVEAYRQALSEPQRIFTAEYLIQLNKEMIDYGGGLQGGVRYESGLLLALDKPWFAFGGSHPLYPEPYDKAAALMETLIRTHPFVDGNKRTAYTAGITLLRYLTGEIVEASPEEGDAVCTSVARKEWGTKELAIWLHDHAY